MDPPYRELKLAHTSCHYQRDLCKSTSYEKVSPSKKKNRGFFVIGRRSTGESFSHRMCATLKERRGKRGGPTWQVSDI
jgi:hypothetical protein